MSKNSVYETAVHMPIYAYLHISSIEFRGFTSM